MKLAHIFKDSIIEEASNLQELSPELREKGEDWWYDSLFGKRKDAYELLKILLSDNNGDLKKTLDDIIKRQRDLDNVDGKKYPGKEYVSYRLTVLEKLTKELLKDKIREGKEEENKLVSLTRSIESEMDKVDESLSYEDFAFVVASILKNGYGSSVTAMFMKELANQLKK